MHDWLIRLIDWGGYAGVFLLSLLETVVLPIPSELILPVAGMRAANGPLGLAGVVLAATAGSMTGNTLWFLAARSIGLDRLRRFIERHGRWVALDWNDVERIRQAFERLGSRIVFTGRLVPVVRTFVSIPAGFARMPLAKFLVWSTIGTFLFAGAFAGAGFAAGAQFHRIEEFAAPISSAIVAAILVWYAWRQITWRARIAARERDRP